MINALVFDWGDTVMRDFPECSGPMSGWETVENIPGIEKALSELSARYPCYIATSARESDTEQMKLALRRGGVEHYFRGFASSREIGAAKPEPAYFLHIMKIFGLTPSACVHIGNVYSKDILPAKEIGLQTVFFNEMKQEGLFPAADVIIYHMDELNGALQKLEAR